MKNSFSKIFNSGENKLVSLLKFGSFIFTAPGRKLLLSKLRKSTPPLEYNQWIKARIAKAAPLQDGRDLKITIALSIGELHAARLVAAVNSVIAQTWQNWELLIEGVPEEGLPDILKKDPRIKIIYNKTKRAAAPYSHELLTAATGRYVLFMKQDDMLTMDCLATIYSHIHQYPADGLIYADEDTAHDNGTFSDPYFKSDWAPDTLLSRNYIGHNIIIKKEVLQELDGLCESFYDLNLSVTEIAGSTGHIPMVLFHHHANATAEDDGLAIKSLGKALVRRNNPGTVHHIPGTKGCYRIDYQMHRKEKVSIIIPTKDNTVLLKKTIDSILQKTDYPDYEIIVLNNNSRAEDFFELMRKYNIQQPDRFRCIDANFSFNFARLINVGAQYSTGAYLLLLNNDVEVLHADWMTQMVSYAQHNDTGAVGVKLLYPDDTIQHAGIMLGGDDGAGHVHANSNKNDSGYFGSLKAVTNYAAVTAACLMCRKELFTEVGCMDEALAVEYNDIDLCLNLLSRGYYNVYLPSVMLYHYESATRGHPFRSSASWKQHERELGIFKNKWQILIDNDPFYNANRRLAFGEQV